MLAMLTLQQSGNGLNTKKEDERKGNTDRKRKRDKSVRLHFSFSFNPRVKRIACKMLMPS